MEQNVQDQVKSVQRNGQTATLQEKNSEIGIKHNNPSKYIKSIKCIIRGECNNLNSSKRNAVMTGNSVIDKKTCKIFLKLIYAKIYLSFNTFS